MSMDKELSVELEDLGLYLESRMKRAIAQELAMVLHAAENMKRKDFIRWLDQRYKETKERI